MQEYWSNIFTFFDVRLIVSKIEKYVTTSSKKEIQYHK